MSVCKPGTTIIDSLTLCYKASDDFLSFMRDVCNKTTFDKFYLKRGQGERHSQYFSIKLNKMTVATIYFDRYGAKKKEPYIWLRIENYVLYNKYLLIEVLSFAELLDLEFNNFTYIELAKDFRYNVSAKIRGFMRNKELTTLINGKEIKDRNKILKNITSTCNMSLNRDDKKSLTIKQAKAVKNKRKGITLNAYDKVKEINSKSQKKYILDFYGNPKRLHRLELRLNNGDIKKIAKSMKITITEDIIFDIEKLNSIYKKALESLIRFKKKRKKLDWQMLFDCNMRYR